MVTTRRNFIRDSVVISSGILLTSYRAFRLSAEAEKFLEKIGISTSIENNGSRVFFC
jgi:hypothetical protein